MDDEIIYLDYAATAPLHPVVRQHINEWLDVFGNPSSLHRMGMEAESLLALARERIQTAIDAPKGQLVFTGGGTEANNLAVFGSVRQLANRGKHVITTAVEHPAVLEACRAIEREGWRVTYLQPDVHGDIQTEDVLKVIQNDTVLISMMHVNNETGALFPIAELGDALRAYPKIRFHVDGTQALGKIPVSLRELGVDLYTMSAHKVGGLKGTGALFRRQGVELVPHIVGGGQEFGLRSGTENVLGAIAFAKAVEAALDEIKATSSADAMKRYHEFVRGLKSISGWQVIQPTSCSPYIVSAMLFGLKGEVVVHALETSGVIVSSGSACSTARGKQSVSHVLQAMGVPHQEAQGVVRFSWHPGLSQSKLNKALTHISHQTEWLQRMLRG